MKESSVQPKGAGGWLLFLCIILTVLTPLGILAGMSGAVALMDETKDLYPTFSDTVILMTLPRFVLVCLSIRAGVLLWKEEPGAVAKAQTFLIAYVAYSIALICVAYVGDLPPAARDLVRNAYGVSALQVLFFATVWHQYLSRSARVRNTFRP
jgi:hypothetical protein